MGARSAREAKKGLHARKEDLREGERDKARVVGCSDLKWTLLEKSFTQGGGAWYEGGLYWSQVRKRPVLRRIRGGSEKGELFTRVWGRGL